MIRCLNINGWRQDSRTWLLQPLQEDASRHSCHTIAQSRVNAVSGCRELPRIEFSGRHLGSTDNRTRERRGTAGRGSELESSSAFTLSSDLNLSLLACSRATMVVPSSLSYHEESEVVHVQGLCQVFKIVLSVLTFAAGRTYAAVYHSTGGFLECSLYTRPCLRPYVYIHSV